MGTRQGYKPRPASDTRSAFCLRREATSLYISTVERADPSKYRHAIDLNRWALELSKCSFNARAPVGSDLNNTRQQGARRLCGISAAPPPGNRQYHGRSVKFRSRSQTHCCARVCMWQRHSRTASGFRILGICSKFLSLESGGATGNRIGEGALR
jgi:hypothetical protein